MTLQKIADKVINELKKEKQDITPLNYSQKFCQVAKEMKVKIEECQLDYYLEKLSPYLQEEFKKHNTEDFNDFILFLISSLNRLSSGDTSKQNLILITLVKRLLQTITFLHDKEATKLANISLDRLEYITDINTIEMLKNKWFDFLTTYDDSYLNEFDAICTPKSHNLDDIVNSAIKCINEKTNQGMLDNFAKIIIASLNPSIANSVDDELAELSYELKKDPSLLLNIEIQEKIKTLLKKRVQIDKDEIKSKLDSLNEILDDLSHKLLSFVDNNFVNKEKLLQIKEELRKSNSSNFDTLKEKIGYIVQSLEVENDSISNKIQKENDLITILQKRMHRLEMALKKAKKESKIDFLTKLSSRKYLEDELKMIESAYDRYGVGYSIVFFDIDNFKMINDTFGHEAGDIILKDLGKVFKANKREADIIGRYGGEEFLAILPKTDIEGAFRFAEKMRNRVENHQFMYKDDRILVTISGGIAQRENHNSLDEVIEEADRMLFNSKNSGRNVISPSLIEHKESKI